MSQARQATIEMWLEGKDVSTAVNTFLESFSYEESASNEADTASVKLNDKEELWIGDWFPKKGTTAKIAIVTTNWNNEGKETVNLGRFEVDEVKNSFPPALAEIKFNSIPNNSKLRNVDSSKSWEKVKLSQIASDIAISADMELFYDTTEDPIIERAEQSDQSSLKFLSKLCTNAGLALKVTDNKIAIFDFEKYEAQAAVATYTKGISRIISFEATSKLNETYKSCQVTYKHGKKKEKIEGSYTASDKEDGPTLKINQKVETKEEADKLAKKKLREKNKEEDKINMKVVGNLVLSAGLTIEVKGFHVHDGKYLIEKISHSIGSGFTTSLELSEPFSI